MILVASAFKADPRVPAQRLPSWRPPSGGRVTRAHRGSVRLTRDAGDAGVLRIPNELESGAVMNHRDTLTRGGCMRLLLFRRLPVTMATVCLTASLAHAQGGAGRGAGAGPAAQTPEANAPLGALTPENLN